MAKRKAKRAPKLKRPYGLGFNGHARKCDCASCAKARVDAVKAYVKAPKVALPKTQDSTVLVRAHFRRQPRHLKRMPATRDALRSWLAEWSGR